MKEIKNANTMNMQSGINDIVDIANKASTTTIKSHSVSLVKISQNGTHKKMLCRMSICIVDELSFHFM
jgi:hypothetical protein